MAIVTLGIDIAKEKFDVALFRDEKYVNVQFDNQEAGFKKLVTWLKKHKCTADLHICMEATGVYSQEVAAFLVGKNYKVSVVNPARIKYFAQSKLSRNKTDKADAQLIAEYCLLNKPLLWQPPAKHLHELQSLVRRAESLQKHLLQEQNRLKTCGDIVRESCCSVIAFTKAELKTIKATIKSHIKSHDDLQHKSNLLITIPGVSDVTISWILAFVGDPHVFENAKQLTAFVGLNPQHRQSGTSVRGKTRLSKIGDRQLRKVLYMPAVVAKQCNPIIRDFCDRLLATGKSKMTVICAAMRKLLSIIYGVLKNNQPFDPNWELSTC